MLFRSVQQNPERIAALYAAGKEAAQVSKVVAGVAEPLGADEVRAMADAILSGAFKGDFDVALERFAAFCRVISLGETHHADSAEAGNSARATELTRNARQLVVTAEDLEHSAEAWRRGELD